MSRHYKRIYCCGDCVYYDWKKHKCKRGAHDEGKAQDHFFADCPLDDFIEEDKSKAENKDKRTDLGIEEAISFFKDMNECTYGNLEEVEMAIKALEQFDVLDKIRAEIERLHYHPKLDFIKNDEVVEMALDIIDKYRAEQGVSNADSD